MESEGSLHNSKQPTTWTYPEPDKYIHAFTSHFLKFHFNIILPLTSRVWSGSFPQVSPPKPCMHLSCPPYVLHAPPKLFFLIWSSELHFVRSTDHKTLRYVFSLPLCYLVLLRPKYLSQLSILQQAQPLFFMLFGPALSDILYF